MSEQITDLRAIPLQSLKDLRQVLPGTWKVARANGVIEARIGKPTIAAVLQAIGADCLDTVNLRNEHGYHTGVVMLVDDTGMLTGKSKNAQADAVYQAQCFSGNPHHICGDVAFVCDGDFASVANDADLE